MLDAFTPWPADVADHYRKQGYWQGRTLHQEFDVAVARNPSATAAVDHRRRVSYAELDKEAADFARGLIVAGVGVGERVVVQLPNVIEFLVAMLGAFRAGVIPVLALPGHRDEEIRHLCRHSAAVGYLAADRFQGYDHRALFRRVQPDCPSVRLVVFVGDPQEFQGFSALAASGHEGVPLPEVSSSDVALLLLSGGTTGYPKLIPRTHDDYSYNARACATGLATTSSSVYLAANPAAHNAALGCPGVLGTLFVGGKVVLARNPSPDEVFPLIEREGVTFTTLVPSLALLWSAAAKSGNLPFRPGLLLQVGSSKFGPDVAAEVQASLQCRITNWYGIGEGLLTFTRLDDEDDVVFNTEGRPLSADDEVRIVDTQDRPIPVGEVGEVQCRGPYTIRGYFDAPAHNATAFTSSGYFRTGDLASFTAEGNIVIRGRTKDIINRLGEKVSAEEVENHVLSHPGVQAAAVVGIPDRRLGERVCVFVVAAGDQTLALPELKAYIRDRGLAAYKLPDELRTVPALPLTPVGKVDKNALRAAVPAA